MIDNLTNTIIPAAEAAIFAAQADLEAATALLQKDLEDKAYVESELVAENIKYDA